MKNKRSSQEREQQSEEMKLIIGLGIYVGNILGELHLAHLQNSSSKVICDPDWIIDVGDNVFCIPLFVGPQELAKPMFYLHADQILNKVTGRNRNEI